MPATLSTIASLRHRYLARDTDPLHETDIALVHSDCNAGHNVYLAQDADWSRAQATALHHNTLAAQPLWGIPVSLKDCFDLAGFPTSCGSTFYRDHHGIAAADSAIAARLRSAGAVITGKTHLHQLAYGITGQNRDFGDCLQPRDPTLLTGGSSSGAAASVQEGSALAAIGTDTGGSIRVPAALCGLSGYRSSLSLNTPTLWRGAAHLAPSFDTIGFLYRDLADGPLLAHALFNLPIEAAPSLAAITIGIPHTAFFHDAEPGILAHLDHWHSALTNHHVTVTRFDATFWNTALEIFAPIQASEAAVLHRGNFHHFEPLLTERLTWGASLSPAEILQLRARLEIFRAKTATLFQHCDYLLLPCSPTSTLRAADDQTTTRARILRYTTPISLCGLPTVTLSGGLQLVAPQQHDATLLALSTTLANLDAWAPERSPKGRIPYLPAERLERRNSEATVGNEGHDDA